MNIESAYAKVRLILPKDLRAAAGWMPDEPVEVGLVKVGGRKAMLIIAAFTDDPELDPSAGE